MPALRRLIVHSGEVGFGRHGAFHRDSLDSISYESPARLGEGGVQAPECPTQRQSSGGSPKARATRAVRTRLLQQRSRAYLSQRPIAALAYQKPIYIHKVRSFHASERPTLVKARRTFWYGWL